MQLLFLPFSCFKVVKGVWFDYNKLGPVTYYPVNPDYLDSNAPENVIHYEILMQKIL